MKRLMATVATFAAFSGPVWADRVSELRTVVSDAIEQCEANPEASKYKIDEAAYAAKKWEIIDQMHDSFFEASECMSIDQLAPLVWSEDRLGFLSDDGLNRDELRALAAQAEREAAMEQEARRIQARQSLEQEILIACETLRDRDSVAALTNPVCVEIWRALVRTIK